MLSCWGGGRTNPGRGSFRRALATTERFRHQCRGQGRPSRWSRLPAPPPPPPTERFPQKCQKFGFPRGVELLIMGEFMDAVFGEHSGGSPPPQARGGGQNAEHGGKSKWQWVERQGFYLFLVHSEGGGRAELINPPQFTGGQAPALSVPRLRRHCGCCRGHHLPPRPLLGAHWARVSWGGIQVHFEPKKARASKGSAALIGISKCSGSPPRIVFVPYREEETERSP